MYERLFTPVRIGDLEIKNRIVMPAISHMYTPDGYATERFNEYYWRRAEGGAGLITVGGCRIDECGGAYGMMSLEDDKYIPGFFEFTEGMHKRGARVGVQLFHAGAYAKSEANNGEQPIGPSAVRSNFAHSMPREMTEEDIEKVIGRARDAAARAKKAGFDIIEISASAGYLICQFLSPLTNKRTDAYGGTWENRVRFAGEFTKAVIQGAGGLPVAARIAGDDLVPGSNTNDDAVRFAEELEKWGIDMLNVTGGWHESKVPQVTGDLPAGGFSYLAAAVKDAVGIPVAVSNRISDPGTAEKLLALETADMVSIGRPLIADPDWCRKAAEGRTAEIRRCMACNQGCLANVFFNSPAECLVNGQAGREYLLKDLKAPAEKQKILVIGAGPAGCDFAIRAAELGHSVTVWEKQDHLGGELDLVAVPPHKQEYRNLIKYYGAALETAGVEVITGKEAVKEDIEAEISEGADAVVIAAGTAKAKIPELPVTDGTPVYSSNEILAGRAVAGRNVLMVGGGSAGCETAQYLACDAALSEQQVYHMMVHGYRTPEQVRAQMDICRRTITIIDIFMIGAGFRPGTGWPVLKDLKRFGVKKYPFTTVEKIGGGEALLHVKDSADAQDFEAVTVPCDTVVAAVGSVPDDRFLRELRDADVPVYAIGDAKEAGGVLEAVRSACDLIGEHFCAL
jgi:NADH:flavin oxidoreductases, Old Yellow Enzyme family